MCWICIHTPMQAGMLTIQWMKWRMRPRKKGCSYWELRIMRRRCRIRAARFIFWIWKWRGEKNTDCRFCLVWRQILWIMKETWIWRKRFWSRWILWSQVCTLRVLSPEPGKIIRMRIWEPSTILMWIFSDIRMMCGMRWIMKRWSGRRRITEHWSNWIMRRFRRKVFERMQKKPIRKFCACAKNMKFRS